MLNEVLKICEKWPSDVKASIKKQYIHGGCILKIFIRSAFEPWNTM